MKMSEATTWGKKVLTLNDIKGVDLSSAPLRVKQTRASYMKNMICKDGANHKRNGFEQVASFYDENGAPLAINGIFPYTSEGEQFKIVHAGTRLYKCSADFSTKEAITLDGVELGSEKSQGYASKGKLYLSTGGRLLVYDGEKVSALFDSEEAYVPTTSIGITDTAHGSLIEPFEGVNMFSAKRINKLTGAKSGTVYTIEVDEGEYHVATLDNSEGVFYLDGEIDTSKHVTITANVFASNKANEESLSLHVMYLYVDENGESQEVNTFNRTVKTVFKFAPGENTTNGVSTITIGEKELAVNSFKEIGPGISSVTGYSPFEGSFKATIENRDGRGVVTFTPALPSPVLGEDNITVEYYTVKNEPKIKAICECSANTYNKMLAIATEDDVVYYSSPSEGYSYFPDNNYLKAIDNVSTLFAGGDFLSICSQKESAIVTFSVDSSGKKIVCVPSLVSKHTDIGCLASLSPAYVEGDTLFLSEKGVYGASIGGIHMRSGNINKELLSFSQDKLMRAIGIEHEGMYYLFVEGNTYIADARYKTYESNRLDVSYEYEWWRWEGCPCRVATSHMGKMLLGREDGRILMLGKGYSDVTYYELNSSEVLTEGYSFVFNEELGVDNNGQIKIENAYKYLANGSFEYLSENTARIVFEHEELLNVLQKGILLEGQNVRIFTKPQRVIADVTITELSLEDQSIHFEYTPEENELQVSSGVTIYAPCAGELFTPQKNEETADELWDYILIDSYGEQASFVDLEEIKITLIKREPVECELHSAVLNLGTDIKKKTLHKLVFVPGIETLGVVEIGYETDKSIAQKRQAVTGELDFSALDFGAFTFDTLFYRSFERRLHERNVQFVKFKFKSLSEGDFSIENFSCVFSVNTR